MNRRGFFSVLAGAAIAFDPERALWVPGKKRLFVPRVCLIPDPAFQIIKLVADKALPILRSHLVMADMINRRYDQVFTFDGGPIVVAQSKL